VAASLPERPAVSAPPSAGSTATARSARAARQPYLGLLGLLLVVPVAALVAVGAGGPESSLRVLAPLVTFALPVVAMVAFWWEDWPGSSLRPGWSGLVDTMVVAVLAVVLTLLGLLVVGGDPGGVFTGAAFPGTMPLAGAAFVAMLQLTLVCEGWPLRRLDRFTAGLAALAVSWAVALVLYAAGVHRHPAFGAFLVLVGAWQVAVYLVWRGWPVAGVHRRGRRIAAGNALVLGGAALTAAAAGAARPATVSAAAGAFIAAGLVIAMLFEGWLSGRAAALAVTVALAAALYAALTAYARSVPFTSATGEEWVAHAGLNAIGVAVILHVAIGRRWPFAAADPVTGSG
jgi:hypothetical protein